MKQKEREKEEKIKNGEKIEQKQEEFNTVFFFIFVLNFFLDSLEPNKFTAFTSFDPEKD
jgi:hypothetical protein